MILRPNMKTRYLFTGLLVLCASCATGFHPKTTQNYATWTTISHPAYKNWDEIIGPSLKKSPNLLMLEAHGKDGRVTSYQIYFTVYHSSPDRWAFYQSATDSDGRELQVYDIAQEAGRDRGGGVSEPVAIAVSRDYLEKHAA